MRDIDAVYYGYMDDEDGVLIPLEEEEEAKGCFFKISDLFLIPFVHYKNQKLVP